MLDYQDGADAIMDRHRRRAGLWRELAGPSRAERWRAAAGAVGGEFVAGPRFGSDRIVVRLDPWVATLTDCTQAGGRSGGGAARVVVAYVGTDGFRCSAVDAGLWSYAAGWLGFRDVRVGDARFDEAYVLRGNDRAVVLAVFGDPVVTALVRRLMTVDLRAGAGRVTLHTTGEVGNAARLRTQFDLCFAVVGRLAALGLAGPAGA